MASGDGIDAIELEESSTMVTSKNHPQNNITTIVIKPTIETTEEQLESAIESTNNEDNPEGEEIQIATTSAGNSSAGGGVSGPSGIHNTGTMTSTSGRIDKEKKIGHRRVGEGGEITYKKIQTSTIMGSIQLGIQHTVGSLASKPKRDLLMMDFWEIESISFPPDGSSITPAHHYSEFRFKVYAPIAFRYFRDLFGIQPDDFMMSMCSAPLRELSNPGASGSIFYLTDDDEFIIKTVQHKEGEFLQKLLPGYYMNLNQNPRTLLPKFFGLYCFQCNSKNIRLVVMNNLLPTCIKMHLKYDLKGSTYKRKASKVERGKSSPTYKDLDFMEHHPNGIFLEADTYNALMKTIQRDCTVLESFKIMDYSLLVGVHNLDSALKERQLQNNEQFDNQNFDSLRRMSAGEESDLEDAPEVDQFIAQEEGSGNLRARGGSIAAAVGGATNLSRSKSINRQRLVAHSTAMESIQAESEPNEEENEDVPPGGIPARTEKGERLLIFLGIIDILQSYGIKKKFEHTFKSIIHDGDTVSVCRPSFYAQRFQNFMGKTVFKKIPSPLKPSQSKRKTSTRVGIPLKGNTTGGLNDNIDGSVNEQMHYYHHHYPNSSGMSSGYFNNNSNYNHQKQQPHSHLQRIVVNDHHHHQRQHDEHQQDQQDDNTNYPESIRFQKTGTTSSCSTPPPAFDDISQSSGSGRHRQNSTEERYITEKKINLASAAIVKSSYRECMVNIADIKLDMNYASSSGCGTVTSSSSYSSSGRFSASRGMLTRTPTASVEGSTPTWTEGTPSYTESSSSGDLENFSSICIPKSSDDYDKKEAIEERRRAGRSSGGTITYSQKL